MATTGENTPNRRLVYLPSPAHKTATSEAGPPRWHPDKSACPNDLSLAEREQLLSGSVPEDPADPFCPVRYAIRRGADGLEWFVTRLTVEHVDGGIEIHGYPFAPGCPKVPPAVLRRLRDSGRITSTEYKSVVRR